MLVSMSLTSAARIFLLIVLSSFGTHNTGGVKLTLKSVKNEVRRIRVSWLAQVESICAYAMGDRNVFYAAVPQSRITYKAPKALGITFSAVSLHLTMFYKNRT